MLKPKECKTCGSDIVFDYKTPTKSFRIEDGKIIRDDAWTGPGYDNPQIEFYCSNDREHDIEDVNGTEVNKWCDKVENYFIENALYDL